MKLTPIHVERLVSIVEQLLESVVYLNAYFYFWAGVSVVA